MNKKPDKKYEILGGAENSITIGGIKCYRIRAVRSFSDVKEGDLGGYVSNENILAHGGACWIYDRSVVAGKASKVGGNATVKRNSILLATTVLRRNAEVISSRLSGNRVYVTDNAKVINSEIRGSMVYNGNIIIDGVCGTIPPPIANNGFRTIKDMKYELERLESLTNKNNMDDSEKKSKIENELFTNDKYLLSDDTTNTNTEQTQTDGTECLIIDADIWTGNYKLNHNEDLPEVPAEYPEPENELEKEFNSREEDLEKEMIYKLISRIEKDIALLKKILK